MSSFFPSVFVLQSTNLKLWTRRRVFLSRLFKLEQSIRKLGSSLKVVKTEAPLFCHVPYDYNRGRFFTVKNSIGKLNASKTLEKT